MKRVLFFAALLLLVAISCNKKDESTSKTLHTATREGIDEHSFAIDSANMAVVAFNDLQSQAGISDTVNQTMWFETEMFQRLGSNPNVSGYTVRLALYQGHYTVVISGWDKSTGNILSEDQHAFASCARCRCCPIESVKINADGTVQTPQ